MKSFFFSQSERGTQVKAGLPSLNRELWSKAFLMYRVQVPVCLHLTVDMIHTPWDWIISDLSDVMLQLYNKEGKGLLCYLEGLLDSFQVWFLQGNSIVQEVFGEMEGLC